MGVSRARSGGYPGHGLRKPCPAALWHLRQTALGVADVTRAASSTSTSGRCRNTPSRVGGRTTSVRSDRSPSRQLSPTRIRPGWDDASSCDPKAPTKAASAASAPKPPSSTTPRAARPRRMVRPFTYGPDGERRGGKSESSCRPRPRPRMLVFGRRLRGGGCRGSFPGYAVTVCDAPRSSRPPPVSGGRRGRRLAAQGALTEEQDAGRIVPGR